MLEVVFSFLNAFPEWLTLLHRSWKGMQPIFFTMNGGNFSSSSEGCFVPFSANQPHSLVSMIASANTRKTRGKDKDSAMATI